MMLRLPEHRPWDVWTVAAGDELRVFNLRAPRALGHAEGWLTLRTPR
jgi:hypothetical protein